MISRPRVWFSKPNRSSQSLVTLFALERAAKKRSSTGSEVNVRVAISSSLNTNFALRAERSACLASAWRLCSTSDSASPKTVEVVACAALISALISV